GPERVELGVGELQALHAAADRRAAQAELLHAVLELAHREVGILQRDAGKGDEAVGRLRAELGELLVLQLDHFRHEVAVERVPGGIDAERLHVDALLVHALQALGHGAGIGGRPLLLHQRLRFGDDGLRVDVDRPYALAAHHDLAPAHLRVRVGEEAAADECNAGGDEFPPGGHGTLLRVRNQSVAAAPTASANATPRSIQARVAKTSLGCGMGGPEDIQKWNAAMASQASAPRISSIARRSKASRRGFMRASINETAGGALRRLRRGVKRGNGYFEKL